MRRNFLALTILCGLLCSAASADAQVTKADAGCRAAIQKNTAKVAKAALKAIDTCIAKVQLDGSPGTDCNDRAIADSQSGLKISAAMGKAERAIVNKCSSVPPGYPDCPSPGNSADSSGATPGIDDVAELSDCEILLNVEPLEGFRDAILRPDAGAIASSAKADDITKCANAIAKGSSKLWSTVAKSRAKCQTDSDKLGGPYAYGCSTADPGGKIAGATTKLNDAILKSCQGSLTDSDLALLRSCASSTAGLVGCVHAAVKNNAGGATAAAFELAGICPASIRLMVNGGDGLSSTRFDNGWNGFDHDSDVAGGYALRLNMLCSSDDCSSCVLAESCAEGNCRCSNDAGVACSNPFAGGGPCGAGTCQFHFGPPVPSSAGGSPVCTVTTIPSALSGGAVVGYGFTVIYAEHNSKIFLGYSQPQPCPVCSGANVGDAGTCVFGARNGLACTTNAIDSAFGATSYDCPPSPAANISGGGLKSLRYLTTDQSPSLPAGDACDAPLGAFDCFCGACSLDPRQACKIDTDCSGMGLGTCSNAGGPVRQPNGCDGFACSADPDDPGSGSCTTGPDDTYCSGLLRSNGDGYITCANNADCTVIDPGAGTCSQSRRRKCFLDPIVAAGVSGTTGAEMVSTFCTAVSTNVGVNASYGLPGPGRLRLDLGVKMLCSDGVTEFELGGANCP